MFRIFRLRGGGVASKEMKREGFFAALLKFEADNPIQIFIWGCKNE